jgi:hypothetical protein
MAGLSHNGVKEIYPEARRAVGQWPTVESQAARLLADLTAAAETEPTLRHSKLRQTAFFLGPGGKDLLTNLLSTVIARVLT